VVGQAFDLLGHSLPGECLQSRDDPGMQRAPPLLEQRLVGHLLGEGVLEGVLDVGEQARLIEELRRLEVSQTTIQRLVGQVRNGLEQRQRHLGTHHRRRLQETLLLGWQSVDTRCQDRLYGGWDLDGRQGLGQVIGPWLPDEPSRLHQRADALFQKERITLGPGDQ
jgi:hypothetical protein